MAVQEGGSRYLKEPFGYAHEARVEATERVMDVRFEGVEKRLERIEAGISSVEKRLWVMVFGVVGVILTEGVQSILNWVPNGGG
jgi:hypothetical protein